MSSAVMSWRGKYRTRSRVDPQSVQVGLLTACLPWLTILFHFGCRGLRGVGVHLLAGLTPDVVVELEGAAFLSVAGAQPRRVAVEAAAVLRRRDRGAFTLGIGVAE